MHELPHQRELPGGLLPDGVQREHGRLPELPGCKACDLPSNAYATGAGLITSSNYVDTTRSCAFACNAGFFYVSNPSPSAICYTWSPVATSPCYAACRPWNPVGLCTALPGYYWGGGTPIADNQCVPCEAAVANGALVQWPPSTSLTTTTIDVCAWTCSAGAYLAVLQQQCVPCYQGKYNPSRGRSLACQPCPAGAYQNSPGSTMCFAVPAGGVATPDQTDFTCLPGYLTNANYAGGGLCSSQPLPAMIDCAACRPCMPNGVSPKRFMMRSLRDP